MFQQSSTNTNTNNTYKQHNTTQHMYTGTLGCEVDMNKIDLSYGLKEFLLSLLKGESLKSANAVGRKVFLNLFLFAVKDTNISSIDFTITELERGQSVPTDGKPRPSCL